MIDITQNSYVLHVYRTYFPDPPGGLQEAIRQIALAGTAAGLEQHIYALSPSPVPMQIARPEGRVVRSRSWMAPASCDIGGIGALRLFSRLARETSLLHYHFPWPFADFLHSVTKPAAPAVMTYHSDIVRQRLLGSLYSPLMWSMLRSMKAIVATSPAYIRTSPVLSHPTIRDKVRMIPLGIEENSYPDDGDDSVFGRIYLHADEPYFLFVGMLRYYKGLDFLVQAAKSVAAKVVIAGSGPELPRLKTLASEMDVKNVVFAGQVTDAEKVALLKNCRALILPSHLRSEAFGMVLVEAAMLGRPLISCEIGTGTSYVNVHEETGFVVPPMNPDVLAKAMISLLMDERLAASFGRHARTRYEQFFSGKAMGRAYAELYREVMS
ncbi:MAG: glycosyltransferase [Pseudomonadota bacterium]